MHRFSNSFILTFIGLALATVAMPATAAMVGSGVPVGNSDLIAPLDYSDTFTGSDFGGLNDRDGVGGYPLSIIDYPPPGNGIPGEGLAVEDNHGNPPQTWTDWKWSIARDATVNPGTAGYPGGSGAGSDTGMTQTGGGGVDWGIEYGLRNNFVVQADLVQTVDRIDVTAGAVRDMIFDPGNLSVFFRTTDHPDYPEIGLFNAGIGEFDTGLNSGIAAPCEWHNYAVNFDLDEKRLEVFVDEVSRGVVDLATVGGGVFADLVLSNEAVGIGYAGGDRGWSDNFQVGALIPEPGTLLLAATGLAALAIFVWRRRR